MFSHVSLQILGYADYAFTSIFTVEILLKVRRPTTNHTLPFPRRLCLSDFLSLRLSDDSPRSLPPPGLLLQELVQPAGLAGGQRLTGLLLPAVSIGDVPHSRYAITFSQQQLASWAIKLFNCVCVCVSTVPAPSPWSRYCESFECFVL